MDEGVAAFRLFIWATGRDWRGDGEEMMNRRYRSDDCSTLYPLNIRTHGFRLMTIMMTMTMMMTMTKHGSTINKRLIGRVGGYNNRWSEEGREGRGDRVGSREIEMEGIIGVNRRAVVKSTKIIVIAYDIIVNNGAPAH